MGDLQRWPIPCGWSANASPGTPGNPAASPVRCPPPCGCTTMPLTRICWTARRAMWC